jgi:hypothetical protein
MTSILSDTIYIDKTSQIETYLKDNYGEIVRWAIVEVTEDQYKIAFSYEAKEAQTN